MQAYNVFLCFASWLLVNLSGANFRCISFRTFLALNHLCCPSPSINRSSHVLSIQMKETYISTFYMPVAYKRSGIVTWHFSVSTTSKDDCVSRQLMSFQVKLAVLFWKGQGYRRNFAIYCISQARHEDVSFRKYIGSATFQTEFPVSVQQDLLHMKLVSLTILRVDLMQRR